MKILQFTVMTLFVCVQQVHADSLFVAPAMIVRDSVGALVGPVVGFARSNVPATVTEDLRPIIRIIDDVTDVANPVPVFVSPTQGFDTDQVDELEVVPGTETFFTESNCTVTAYHLEDALVRAGSTVKLTIAKMTGVFHSIARRGVGGNMELFASKLNDSPVGILAYSTYTDGKCFNLGGSGGTVVPATAIKTLNYTTPFLTTPD